MTFEEALALKKLHEDILREMENIDPYFSRLVNPQDAKEGTIGCRLFLLASQVWSFARSRGWYIEEMGEE